LDRFRQLVTGPVSGNPTFEETGADLISNIENRA